MSITVFNKDSFDPTKEFMFFGKQLNVSRFDKQKFEFFENKNRRMISLYWVPEEINMTNDYRDFNEMSEGEQHIYISNLQYQTLLDSVQGRSPAIAFLPVCSLPELEGCIETWSFFETIHSRSYSHMMRNVFNDPSEVFDKIVVTPEIIERAQEVTKAYDDFINAYYSYTTGGNPHGHTLYELKEKLFDAVVSVNILEAIRFYVSFACTLAFDKQGKMRGSAKIITLIARDEFEHKFFTQHILRLWRENKDDPDMHRIFNERKHIAEEMYRKAAEQEKEWANFLFSKGTMRGLNEKILCQYVEYITHNTMKGLGLDPCYEEVNHPIPWIESYFESSRRQDPPQERENTAYLVGAVDTSLDDDDMDEFGDYL